MISDLDIYRTAKLLVDKHGAEAPTQLIRRGQLVVVEGMGGGLTWAPAALRW